MKSGDENLGKRWSDMDAVPPLLELPNSGEEVQAGQRKNLAIDWISDMQCSPSSPEIWFSLDDFEDVGI